MLKRLACCFGQPQPSHQADADDRATVEAQPGGHAGVVGPPSPSSSFTSELMPAAGQPPTLPPKAGPPSVLLYSADNALVHGASTSMSGSSYTHEVPGSASSAYRSSDTSGVTSAGHMVSSQHSSVSEADVLPAFIHSLSGTSRMDALDPPSGTSAQDPASSSSTAGPSSSSAQSSSSQTHRSTMQLSHFQPPPDVPLPPATSMLSPQQQPSSTNPTPTSSEYAAMVQMALMSMRQPDRPLSTIVEGLSSSNVSSKASSMNHRSLVVSRAHSHAGSSSSDRLYRTMQGAPSEGDVLYSLNSTNSSSVQTPPRASSGNASVGRPNSDTAFESSGSRHSSGGNSDSRDSSRSAPMLTTSRLLPGLAGALAAFDSSGPSHDSSSSKSAGGSMQVEADSVSMRSSVTFATGLTGLKDDAVASPAPGSPVDTRSRRAAPSQPTIILGSTPGQQAPYAEVDLSARPSLGSAATRWAAGAPALSTSAPDMSQPGPASSDSGEPTPPDSARAMMNMFRLLSPSTGASSGLPSTRRASTSAIPEMSRAEPLFSTAEPTTSSPQQGGQPAAMQDTLAQRMAGRGVVASQVLAPSTFPSMTTPMQRPRPSSLAPLGLNAARYPGVHPGLWRPHSHSNISTRWASAGSYSSGSGTNRALGGTAAVQDLLTQFSAPQPAPGSSPRAGAAAGVVGGVAGGAGGSTSTGAGTQQPRAAAGPHASVAVLGADGGGAGPSRPSSSSTGVASGNEVRQQLLAVRQRSRKNSGQGNTGQIMKLDIPSMEDV